MDVVYVVLCLFILTVLSNTLLSIYNVKRHISGSDTPPLTVYTTGAGWAKSFSEADAESAMPVEKKSLNKVSLTRRMVLGLRYLPPRATLAFMSVFMGSLATLLLSIVEIAALRTGARGALMVVHAGNHLVDSLIGYAVSYSIAHKAREERTMPLPRKGISAQDRKSMEISPIKPQ